MAWIKISDEDGGVYAREPEPDPAEVITIADIEAEIAELRERIRAAETNLIPVPEKADARVAEAVGLYNQTAMGDIIQAQGEISDKEQLIKDLRSA